jgi:hypothetical protein
MFFIRGRRENFWDLVFKSDFKLTKARRKKMLKNLRKGIGIVGIIALVALAFTFGCSDSDYSEPDTAPPGKTEHTGIIGDYDPQTGVITEIQTINSADAEDGNAKTTVQVDIPAGTGFRLADGTPPEGDVNLVLTVYDKGASDYENAIATVDYKMKDVNGNDVTTTQPMNFCIQLEEGAATPGMYAYIFKDVGGEPFPIGTQQVPPMKVCFHETGTGGTFYITVEPTGSSGGTT